MKRCLDELARGQFDVCVIGGGIMGAGIARDATLRGLRVALVEQADFASGTSSRSTKLIHGGLRYLEQFAFRLVAESCRERSVLLDMAPHLVKPLPLMIPAYEGDPRSLWKIRLGAFLYHSVMRRHPSLPPHQSISADQAVAQEPLLPRQGLHGAVLIHDCQMDDARLCIETIAASADQGAICANYCRVIGFQQDQKRLVSAQVEDMNQGSRFDIRADVFVNAAGPWVEKIARLSGSDAEITLSPTKGVHLVLPRLTKSHGLYFQTKGDRRMVFLIPWDDDLSLLGTTDTDYQREPEDAYADPADTDYLLSQLKSLLPACEIDPSDIIASFAGVRPLIGSGPSPSSRSREERIVWQAANLLTVAGGKYTTFRATANRAVQLIFSSLDRRAPPCLTSEVPLVERRRAKSGEEVADGGGIFASDVEQACDEEMAQTVDDVMRRRTHLALSRHGGLETAQRVSQNMATQLGWSEATRLNHVQAYMDERKKML